MHDARALTLAATFYMLLRSARVPSVSAMSRSPDVYDLTCNLGAQFIGGESEGSDEDMMHTS